jgi:hypothetical protein
MGDCRMPIDVVVLGTVPSLVRTWEASDCMADLDWSSIRFVFPFNYLTFSPSPKLGVVQHLYNLDEETDVYSSNP